MQIGLGASLGHPENGMPQGDMLACQRVADQLGEVIIFRSTGPWSRRWLSQTPPYPSKNFHVKGKSSDWGPQAGFVPHLGEYSKVGHDPAKAAKGTAANNDGIASGFADRVPLNLSRAEIQMQATQPCEVPPRVAITEVRAIGGRDELILVAYRSGDNTRFNFVAVPSGGGRFNIMVAQGSVAANQHVLADRIASGKLAIGDLKPLEVMASMEVGADQRPMTGDYDLMAICPRWNNYMERSAAVIAKPAIVLRNPLPGHAPKSQHFAVGSAMDKVLDMRIHTGAKTKSFVPDAVPAADGKPRFEEHSDMGNLTPRILRAINALNVAMGGPGALRRVHHNAESHRHGNFGALTSRDMEGGEGFPLTAFHPQSALAGPKSLARFGSICTIERMAEFHAYAGALHDAGFYVPKHWAWNMSIRDSARAIAV